MSPSNKVVFLTEIIRKSLEDDILSRSEKKTIRSHLTDARLTQSQRAELRSFLFTIAREKTVSYSMQHLLDWLEVLDQSVETTAPQGTVIREICFSPGDSCKKAIVSLLGKARCSIDICVFTISDNELAHAIGDCMQRGVPVRIITDDEKTEDRGSDIWYLSGKGIPVRIDNSPHHMHHKFALVDGSSVVTGSFNWTRSASEYNMENIIVIEDKQTVDRYNHEFERLWKSCKNLH